MVALHVCSLLAHRIWHLFTHTLVLCVHKGYLFTHTLVVHVCALCARFVSITWSHVGDRSTCIMVCCHYDNPTSAPTGDPSMVRLPWGL